LIEINPYAHSLAQVTVQIGYIQWLRAHGYGFPAEPILLRLDQNFLLADSLFTDWPGVDFIVSNPPFLGDKMMRGQLGDEYVEKLRALFKDSVPGGADLCCYWFEKARVQIEAGKVKRAGLLATQGIRGGKNREVLKRIRETGDIFWAVSDRDWILEGANVHVSIVAFDGGEETSRTLDGKAVDRINVNLSASADLPTAKPLFSNHDLCFLGIMKAGAFDINIPMALEWLKSPNPNGRPNSDVLRPRVNAMDILRRTGGGWIVDFGCDSLVSDMAQYEQPFGHVLEKVKPVRDENRRKSLSVYWWIHGEPRPSLRRASEGLSRIIVTPEVSKHRVFVWLDSVYLPDHQTRVFARSDDYFFGVLHSRVHETWARAQGTQLRERESGFRYTPTTCFETFPFPAVGRPPDVSVRQDQQDLQDAGKPADSGSANPVHPVNPVKNTTTPDAVSPHVAAIAAAARELNALRERWLNPPEWTREEILEFPASPDGPWARYVAQPSAISDPLSASTGQPIADRRPLTASYTARYPRLVPRDEACAKLLAKRTLTNLYNERPTWLQNAHAQLDAAVCAAYGWPADLSDEQLLEKLLALNLERSQSAPALQAVAFVGTGMQG